MNMAWFYILSSLTWLAVQHAHGAVQPPNLLDTMFAQLQLQKPAMTSNYFMPEASQISIIFPLAHLDKAPTAPASYTSLQMKRWDWLGGTGFLVLTRNDLGEHGVLTEMMYFPGLYQPQCVLGSMTAVTKANHSSLVEVSSSSGSSNNNRSSSDSISSPALLSSNSSGHGGRTGADDHTYSSFYSRDDDASTNDNSNYYDGLYSAQRFWVDMQVSQAVGRAYFGYPKETASFQWTQNSITAKDSLGKVFFSATFSNASTPQTESDSLQLQLPAWFLQLAAGKIPTIQWPINDSLTRLLARVINDHTPAIDATINKLPRDVQKMLRAGAALAQKRAAAVRAEAGIKFLPNTQTLSFPGHSQLAMVTVSKVLFDGLAFTGRSRQRLGLASEAAGVIVGTPGTLSDPVPFSCY